MSWLDHGALALQIAMGIGLAASAGLRAFLPLAAVGLAGRFELVPLGPRFDWLAGGPALTVFGVAVVVELVADKFPVVDHLLDAVQLFVKPAAGALLATAVVGEDSPLVATVLALFAGAATAGGVHLTKAKIRLGSTATTAGVANPVLSVGEDIAALAGSAVSLVAPLAVLVLVVAGGVLLWLVLRRRQSDV